MQLTDIIGFTAGLFTTFASAPQIYKMWCSRVGAGLSYYMVILTMIGIALWIWYGVRRRALPVVVWNVLAMCMFTALLLLKKFHCTASG
jgi:MtN3 and saliva related transmembrane protein